MKVAFRVDASARIGVGHLARCLALAVELRGRGIAACFIVRDDPTFPVTFAARHGFGFYKLAGPAQDAAADAVETMALVRREQARVDWIIVDHYALDAQWESDLRGAAARVLAIDDLAVRRHDCDVLLDQNLRPSGDRAYDKLVPERTRQLLGPQYALLGREFGIARRSLRERDGTVRRLLVSYGGADPGNETAKALAAIAALDRRDLHIDVAAASTNPHLDDLRRLVSRTRNATLHQDLPHLADLIQSADLALGAGGTSTWERLCLGLPSLVTTIADNQVSATRALAELGCLRYLGPAESVTANILHQALVLRLSEAESLRAESVRGRALVDGAGTARVADNLVVPAAGHREDIGGGKPG
jgi:UDP-2,4-diacetamido-2,4,6-trideoxy-beta-L-altropyranose hydrolase